RDLEQPLAQRLEVAARACPPPYVRPAAAAREQPPGDHERLLAVGPKARHRLELRGVEEAVGQLELRLDVRLLAARADEPRRRLRPRQQADGLGEHRLAGARLTGETGAGKTMLAEAICLLAGAQPAAGLVGPRGEEAYVEAEFELPDGFFEAPELEAVAGLRPDGEETLVVARRLLASGRSRALVWGRTCARSDLEALGERLLEVSSQHEARRLAQPARQLELLDGYAGTEALVAAMAEA